MVGCETAGLGASWGSAVLAHGGHDNAIAEGDIPNRKGSEECWNFGILVEGSARGDLMLWGEVGDALCWGVGGGICHGKDTSRSLIDVGLRLVVRGSR